MYISKRRRREHPGSSPGSQGLARTVPATIGRHWRSAWFSISRMSVRKCKGAQGASQGAAGVSGPLGMIPRWPRRPVSLCARAGKELGSGKGGRGLHSQSRRWTHQRLVVARGAGRLAGRSSTGRRAPSRRTKGYLRLGGWSGERGGVGGKSGSRGRRAAIRWSTHPTYMDQPDRLRGSSSHASFPRGRCTRRWRDFLSAHEERC